MSIINLARSGYSGPSVFHNAGPPQPRIVYTDVGPVSLQGGVILTGETNLPADETTIYGTSSYDPALSPTITMTFPVPVKNIAFNLYNGETTPASYSISDNLGQTRTVTIPANTDRGEDLVSFPSNGTQITIQPLTGVLRDYSINNIQFNFDPNAGLANAKSPAAQAWNNLQIADAGAGLLLLAIGAPVLAPVSLLVAGVAAAGYVYSVAVHNDPPDLNYRSEYFPTFSTLPQVTANSDISQSVANDANAIFAEGAQAVSYTSALYTSANRLSSAIQANDGTSIILQNLAVQSYMALAAQNMHAYSQGLIKLAADFSNAHLDTAITAADLLNFQANVKANGLAALPQGAVQLFQSFGLTPFDEQSIVTGISSANLSQAPLSFISALLSESNTAEQLAATYDPSSVAPPSNLTNTIPQIVGTDTFHENGLTYFRLNYTDPDNDVFGFGFRTIYGTEQHTFTNPSFGIVSPGQFEYPFNLGPGTQLDVAAWIFDAAGNRSPEIQIHLA